MMILCTMNSVLPQVILKSVKSPALYAVSRLLDYATSVCERGKYL